MKLSKSFKEIVSFIRNSRLKALYSVNRELIDLYWQIGEYIHKKVEKESWGISVVEKLAEHLSKEFNNARGFSAQNLWRMKQLYEVYHDNKFLSAVLRELSWTNNLIILSKCKTLEEKQFYLQLAIKERYSKRELERQISSGLYERYILSLQKSGSIKRNSTKNLQTPSTKDRNKKIIEIRKNHTPILSPVVRELNNSFMPDLYEGFKDKYIFEFLDLPENFFDKDLHKAFIKNLKNFILEVGKEFIFSVGLIICKTKDDEVVHYAMNRDLSPTLIAEYETKLISTKLLKQKFHELSGYYEKAEKVREIQEYYGTNPIFNEISKQFN